MKLTMAWVGFSGSMTVSFSLSLLWGRGALIDAINSHVYDSSLSFVKAFLAAKAQIKQNERQANRQKRIRANVKFLNMAGNSKLIVKASAQALAIA